MATIIDDTYFFGDLTIAQKSDPAVNSSLSEYIAECEDRLLTELLGYELYKAFKAWNGTADGVYKDLRDGKEYTGRSGYDTKWKGLKFSAGASKKSLIANYVYWHWMFNQASDSTGTGEKVADNQNAVNSSAVPKMIRAWNQMVEWNRELLDFLLSLPDAYPEFQTYYGRMPWKLLSKQNVLGI
jgi:hypothetical protein